MVTTALHGKNYNENVSEIYGLSTDTKPTVDVYGNELANGSIFIEMDTGKGYMWDRENEEWRAV